MSIRERDLELITKTNADSNVTTLVEAFAAKRRPVSRAEMSEVLRHANIDLAGRILALNVRGEVPRLWLTPDPDDVREVAKYMLAVAKECDAWAKEIGGLLGASVDGMKEFTDPFFDALNGNATHVIEELAREIEQVDQ